MWKYCVILALVITILAFGLTSVGCKQSAPTPTPSPEGNVTVTQAWVARYDGGLADDDGAWAIAVDSSDNIYVTGYSWGNGTSSDYATIKYDSTGNQSWVDRYNGPGNSEDWAWDIALDKSGNIYVTGWSTGNGTGSDFATIKYDGSGSQLWVARYNGPANGFDLAYALTLDNAGNVYVTGWSQGNFTDADYATIKYDSSGSQIWVARYNGPASGEDKASAVAVDSADNVYVTGSSTGNGTGSDYTTIKYDSDGNQLWVARYNGSANKGDQASVIASDGLGNIYVTGSSAGNGTETDYATVKYDSHGNQLWATRYSGPANGEDGATVLAVDISSNVYVTGASTGNGTESDYATIKYDVNGNQLWVARYNGPADSEDKTSALVMDSAGNIYVTGWSTGNDTSYDYATIKYSNAGKQLWVARYDGPASRPDKAYALALGSSGSVYVTGRSSGKGTYYDFATIKYTQ
ncbi:MAG: SBBP repeat-containing protein [Chloroflexi bacterium]|nr:SBBP repeat-containing protein [Chloroflexota bacterium]